MEEFCANEPGEVEPDFDLPPTFVENRERRLHVRAFHHWSGRLHGREFPTPADMRPETLEEFTPNAVLLDFSKGATRPQLRFVGERLREECQLPSQPVSIAAVPPDSLLSRLIEDYAEILATRAPTGFEASFVSSRGNETLYRGILLPLSSNGHDIDMMLGVLNWKEMLSADLEAAIHTEAGLI